MIWNTLKDKGFNKEGEGKAIAHQFGSLSIRLGRNQGNIFRVHIDQTSDQGESLSLGRQKCRCNHQGHNRKPYDGVSCIISLMRQYCPLWRNFTPTCGRSWLQSQWVDFSSSPSTQYSALQTGWLFNMNGGRTWRKDSRQRSLNTPCQNGKEVTWTTSTSTFMLEHYSQDGWGGWGPACWGSM